MEKRRILVKEINRLKEDFDVPTRLSFFEECEPDGLFFGYGGIVGDGYCVVCGKDFQDEGLFCSKDCELEYRRNELRRWLEESCLTCEVCGKKIVGKEEYEEIKELLPDFLGKVVPSDPIRHHISYRENIVVTVCRPCRSKIHHTNKYLELQPKDRPKIKRRKVESDLVRKVMEKGYEVIEIGREAIERRKREQ